MIRALPPLCPAKLREVRQGPVGAWLLGLGPPLNKFCFLIKETAKDLPDNLVYQMADQALTERLAKATKTKLQLFEDLRAGKASL
jgi:hypothetical protein